MRLEQYPLPLRAKRPQLTLPLANECIAAGFPSPAEDYIDIGIDLNEQLIQHPASTFFVRVSGHSMIGAGVYDGDLLIVDRSLNPRPNDIVVAILDGCFTLKRFTKHLDKLRLEAENPNYPAIDLDCYGEVQIWGVATYSIHSLNYLHQRNLQ